MSEPLTEIRFSSSPYNLSLIPTVAYYGQDIFQGWQYGVFRVNAYTGLTRYKTGVAAQGTGFPPSNFNLYIASDTYRSASVTQIAASRDWVVINNISPTSANVVGLIFRNDAEMSPYGKFAGDSSYYWYKFGRPPVIEGDLLYVANESGGYEIANLRDKNWVGHTGAQPAVRQTGIGGYTYKGSLYGDPWATGAFVSNSFVMKRADAATETIMPWETAPTVEPPPVVEPPPPVIEPPPPTGGLTDAQKLAAVKAKLQEALGIIG